MVRFFILVMCHLLLIRRSRHDISITFLFPGAITYVIALKCRDLDGRVAESDISNIVRAGMKLFVSTATNDPIDFETTTVTDVTNEPDTITGPDMTNEPDATTGPDMTNGPDATNDPDMTNQPDVTNEPGRTTNVNDEEPLSTEDPRASGQSIIANPGILVAIIYGTVGIVAIISIIIIMAVINQNRALRIARLQVQDPFARFAPYQNRQFLGKNMYEVRIM